MKVKGLKQKHVPLRMCIVTKERLPKGELIRIVKTSDGSIVVDTTGKLKGRGANIKKDLSLIHIALERGVLQRALRIEGKLEKALQEKIIEDFNKAIEIKNFRQANKPVTIRVKKEDVEKLNIEN